MHHNNHYKRLVSLIYMESNEFGLHYWGPSHTEYGKDLIEKYLSSFSDKMKRIFSEDVSVHFNDELTESLNGYVFLKSLNGRGDDLNNILEYVLSKERNYIPFSIWCPKKRDYGLVKKIIKKNFGKNARLSLGRFLIHGLIGERKIIYN
jgi:hypothetical protein